MKTIKQIRKQAVNRDKDFNRTFLEKIYRRINIYLAWVILLFPISGNMISLMCSLSLIVAAGFFTVIEKPFLLLGLFFIFFGEFLDFLDGLVARCRNEVTKLQSTYLASIYHEVALSFIFSGLGIGLYNVSNNVLNLYFGFGATISLILTMYFLQLRERAIYKYSKYVDLKKVDEDTSKIGIDSKKDKFLLSIFVFPMKRIREITTIVILLFVFGYNILHIYLFFYGVFLSLRAVLFFIKGYFSLKTLEK